MIYATPQVHVNVVRAAVGKVSGLSYSYTGSGDVLSRQAGGGVVQAEVIVMYYDARSLYFS